MDARELLEDALVFSGLGSVLAAAPVSLISAWIIWKRNDRSSWRDGWRQKVLFAGMLILSLSAAILVLICGYEWWTKAMQSPMQELVLNDMSVTGAICCMLVMLASLAGKGRARLSVATAGFFTLFLYGVVTPFGSRS